MIYQIFELLTRHFQIHANAVKPCGRFQELVFSCIRGFTSIYEAVA